MDWLALAGGAVKLLQHLFKWLGDRQLISAGEAQAGVKSLDGTIEVLTNAQRAARAVRFDPDSDYSKRLRDKYRRP